MVYMYENGFDIKQPTKVDMQSNPTKWNHIYLIYTYKEVLALNNLQRSICNQTQPNEIIYI